MIVPPPTSTLFPYTTLFRSGPVYVHGNGVGDRLYGSEAGLCRYRSPNFYDRRQRDRVCNNRENEGDSSGADRKSTRLNSSHTVISYAVFCLKKKKKPKNN